MAGTVNPPARPEAACQRNLVGPRVLVEARHLAGHVAAVVRAATGAEAADEGQRRRIWHDSGNGAEKKKTPRAKIAPSALFVLIFGGP